MRKILLAIVLIIGIWQLISACQHTTKQNRNPEEKSIQEKSKPVKPIEPVKKSYALTNW
jgi:hypothetical protein